MELGTTNKTLLHEPATHRLARTVVTLPRSTKRLVMVLADVVAMPICVLLAIWLVTPEILPSLPPWLWIVPLLIGLPALRVWGFYRSVVRFMGLELVEAAVKTITWVSLALLVCIAIIDTWPDALRVSASFWFLGMVYLVGSRLTVRWLLQSRNATGDRVVIYGAGDAGAHFALGAGRPRRVRSGGVRRRQSRFERSSDQRLGSPFAEQFAGADR